MKGFLKWALMILVVGAILTIIGDVISDEETIRSGKGGAEQYTWWLAMLIGAVMIFLGIREKKMSNPSEFTFGRGFTEGLLISVLAGLFTGIFSYVFFTYVSPERIEWIREGSYQAMLDNGAPQSQIDQAKPMMDFFISPLGFMISTLLMYAVFGGLILSLIFSAIVNAIGPKSGGNQPITA